MLSLLQRFNHVPIYGLHSRRDRIIPGSKLRSQFWDVDEEPVSNVIAAQIRLLRRKFDHHGCDCPIETVPGQGIAFGQRHE